MRSVRVQRPDRTRPRPQRGVQRGSLRTGAEVLVQHAGVRERLEREHVQVRSAGERDRPELRPEDLVEIGHGRGIHSSGRDRPRSREDRSHPHRSQRAQHPSCAPVRFDGPAARMHGVHPQRGGGPRHPSSLRKLPRGGDDADGPRPDPEHGREAGRPPPARPDEHGQPQEHPAHAGVQLPDLPPVHGAERGARAFEDPGEERAEHPEDEQRLEPPDAPPRMRSNGPWNRGGSRRFGLKDDGRPHEEHCTMGPIGERRMTG